MGWADNQLISTRQTCEVKDCDTMTIHGCRVIQCFRFRQWGRGGLGDSGLTSLRLCNWTHHLLVVHPFFPHAQTCARLSSPFYCVCLLPFYSNPSTHLSIPHSGHECHATHTRCLKHLISNKLKLKKNELYSVIYYRRYLLWHWPHLMISSSWWVLAVHREHVHQKRYWRCSSWRRSDRQSSTSQ